MLDLQLEVKIEVLYFFPYSHLNLGFVLQDQSLLIQVYMKEKYLPQNFIFIASLENFRYILFEFSVIWFCVKNGREIALIFNEYNF